jgi:hypothetical protein
MLEDEITAPKVATSRPTGRKKKIRWTDELFMSKIMIPLAEGKTINEIAAKLKLTRQAINLRLQENGIKNKTEALQYIIQKAREGNPIQS